jgi:hypothetical protein
LVGFERERSGLGFWYFRADSKGWRMASFFAAASLSALVPFSVSTSDSANVVLEVHALAIDYCYATDRLAISLRVSVPSI